MCRYYHFKSPLCLRLAMEIIRSGCKINLLLNVLRRREDGFHELETVMQPLSLFDELEIKLVDIPGIELQCDHPRVPVGPENLICRAASLFQGATGRHDGLRIRLKKNIPVMAGVGGGSGNAAMTLIGLNRLYDGMLSPKVVSELAGRLGSDVPFFLGHGPAIATGRGEKVRRVSPFSLFENASVVLVNPEFGVPTPWAYQNLRIDQDQQNVAPVPMDGFVAALERGDWVMSMQGLFNSLERPIFRKYPILEMIRSELLKAGAAGALVSGSGAMVFGIVREHEFGEEVRGRFLKAYGDQCWSTVLNLSEA
ncbi:MAG: 4-diphosphocytidyl-2-C-methyl-D-erythritol kinase [Verrucomicrobia subdivision 3 bacterium]|nr:4-diphosphocytidyl-2-C-methyl-D-erythritol kinase [Limisphaerales bacterium]MCS1413847.1 4-diphosphocytidyl-2-C-methyl-D-erythritol kinase [Limisphaerales bacterium]